MRLHENQQLFADAIEAAARPVQDGGLGIKSIFIEKDYWICRSLSLMATGDKDNRAIFKGGTSLTKAYGIGARFSEDIDVNQYVEENGLKTVNDEGALRSVVEQVIADNPRSVADYQAGKTKAIGFLVGQTMKAMKGKADPGMVNKLLKELL